MVQMCFKLLKIMLGKFLKLFWKFGTLKNALNCNLGKFEWVIKGIDINMRTL